MNDAQEILSEDLQRLFIKAREDAKKAIYWTAFAEYSVEHRSVGPDLVESNAYIIRSAFIDLSKRVKVGSRFRTTADLLTSHHFNKVAEDGPMSGSMDKSLEQYLQAGEKVGIFEETPKGYGIKALRFFIPVDIHDVPIESLNSYSDIDDCWKMTLPQPWLWKSRGLCFDVDDLYPRDPEDSKVLAEEVMKNLVKIYGEVSDERYSAEQRKINEEEKSSVKSFP